MTLLHDNVFNVRFKDTKTAEVFILHSRLDEGALIDHVVNENIDSIVRAILGHLGAVVLRKAFVLLEDRQALSILRIIVTVSINIIFFVLIGYMLSETLSLIRIFDFSII